MYDGLVDKCYVGRGDAHHLVIRLVGLRDPRLEDPPLFSAALPHPFPWRLPVLRQSLRVFSGRVSLVVRARFCCSMMGPGAQNTLLWFFLPGSQEKEPLGVRSTGSRRHRFSHEQAAKSKYVNRRHRDKMIESYLNDYSISNGSSQKYINVWQGLVVHTSTHFLRAKSRPHPWTKSFCNKKGMLTPWGANVRGN